MVWFQFLLAHNFALDSVREVEPTKLSHSNVFVGELAVKEEYPFCKSFASPQIECFRAG